MRAFFRTALFISFIFMVSDIRAQKEKETHKVTRKSGVDKEAKAKAEKEAQYVSGREHHMKAQDKATRKRMKKNLKKAERHSWGKDVPWYKRWFRRKRI